MFPITSAALFLYISAFFITSIQTVEPCSVPLFNGNDLSGWHEIGGGKWSVEKGSIVGETGNGTDGWLTTDRVYSNFILDLKFKAEDRGNSGIQFRSHIIDGEMYGYQVECDPTSWELTGGVYENRKRGWLAKPKRSCEHNVKQNAWNSIRIKVIDKHIQTYLNGVLMVDLYDDNATRGAIALQVHSGVLPQVKIRWKDILIRELDHGPSWEPLFNGKTLAGWKEYGREKWYVEDGWIVGKAVTDKYGYLGTERQFSNFEICMTFLAEGTGNSGCFFRSFLEGVDITGVQAEIDPTPGNHTGGLYESSHDGRGWIAQPDELGNKVMGGVGTQNVLRFVTKGNRMVTYVNGWKTVDVIDDKQKNTNGVIALQLHSGGRAVMRWKDIYVNSLD